MKFRMFKRFPRHISDEYIFINMDNVDAFFQESTPQFHVVILMRDGARITVNGLAMELMEALG